MDATVRVEIEPEVANLCSLGSPVSQLMEILRSLKSTIRVSGQLPKDHSSRFGNIDFVVVCGMTLVPSGYLFPFDDAMVVQMESYSCLVVRYVAKPKQIELRAVRVFETGFGPNHRQSINSSKPTPELPKPWYQRRAG
jgi:hypothetical protein